VRQIAPVFLPVLLFLPVMLAISCPCVAQEDEPIIRSTQERALMKNQRKVANQKRQADLKRDTDRLLELATELKAQVDKTNESILSLTVLRKAEEIEKLAHSVKEKMKADANVYNPPAPDSSDQFRR
jgi:predicted metal-dependent hydrolase